MNNLSLVDTITLNNYIVKLYSLNAPIATSLVASNMQSMENDLNNQPYPKEIVDILEKFDDFTRIEVYDKDNKLLVSSGVLFPIDN